MVKNIQSVFTEESLRVPPLLYGHIFSPEADCTSCDSRSYYSRSGQENDLFVACGIAFNSNLPSGKRCCWREFTGDPPDCPAGKGQHPCSQLSLLNTGLWLMIQKIVVCLPVNITNCWECNVAFDYWSPLIRKSFLILKSCANYSKYDSKQPKMTLFDWTETEVSPEAVGTPSCHLEEPAYRLTFICKGQPRTRRAAPTEALTDRPFSDSPCEESASLGRPLTRCKWTQTSWPLCTPTSARWAPEGHPGQGWTWLG